MTEPQVTHMKPIKGTKLSSAPAHGGTVIECTDGTQQVITTTPPPELPWRASPPRTRKGPWNVLAANGQVICTVWGTDDHAEARAKFIAKSANAHDKLRTACEEFVRFADLPSDTVPRGAYIRYQVSAIAAARAALAKATAGKEPT